MSWVRPLRSRVSPLPSFHLPPTRNVMDDITTDRPAPAAPASNNDEPAGDTPDLLPVRMLNEFVYCPRLFHFMHVEGRWEDNVYTIEGKDAHRRVARLDHVLPDPDASDGTQARKDAEGDGDERPAVSRSVSLGSPRLG